ncbi:hypothetical protein KSP39_PZI005782 [Platanthera zijinensis]|uniref:Late embryogenesis abundant protein LEA-2 subgroup domain-containing protein n=1 Tax=Platanthera zijinensis TaxID=2320716 RepID=A0AAP0BTG2_9ASPA
MAEKYPTDHDQIRPLTIPSPIVQSTPDEESGQTLRRRSFQYLKKRRCALWCCGCCGATVVLLGVIILILAFTVFRVKDPELTLNSLTIDSLLVPGIGSLDRPLSVNATLTADISIKNPNIASLRYHNSTTEFYYGGDLVGVAYAPDGNVRARRTVRMNVTVDVLADKVLLDTNATGLALAEGSVNMSSFTDISGRVNLLGLYKRDLDILLNCSFTLGILERSVTNLNCADQVK